MRKPDFSAYVIIKNNDFTNFYFEGNCTFKTDLFKTHTLFIAKFIFNNINLSVFKESKHKESKYILTESKNRPRFGFKFG